MVQFADPRHWIAVELSSPTDDYAARLEAFDKFRTDLQKKFSKGVTFDANYLETHGKLLISSLESETAQRVSAFIANRPDVKGTRKQATQTVSWALVAPAP